MGYSQAVRHRTLTATCVGSNPASPAIFCGSSSVVEYNLAKVGVAGSNPVFRSKNIWRHSQVVRQRSAKPLFTGSNPVAASTRSLVAAESKIILICRCGGIGRRARLKIVFLLECRFDPDHRYHFYSKQDFLFSLFHKDMYAGVV